MNKQQTQGGAGTKVPAPYAIWLEPEEEQKLRDVLRGAHEAQAEEEARYGGGSRLLRDVRKLHQLYSQMARLGFGNEDIERCLSQLRMDASLSDALDWACLHLPESALPASFRMAVELEEEDDKDKERAALLKKIASQPAQAKPEGRFLEAKKRAAAFAKKAAAKAGGTPQLSDESAEMAASSAAIAAVHRAASEWRERHADALAEESSEEEDEDQLADLLGVLDLEELGEPRLEAMLSEKERMRRAAERAADDAEAEGKLAAAGKQARKARRLGRHADQIEAALVRMVPKYKTRMMQVGEAAGAEAKRAARVAKDEERRKAKHAAGGEEDELSFGVSFDGEGEAEDTGGDGIANEGGEASSRGQEKKKASAPPAAVGKEALTSWLGSVCAIGPVDAAAYASALASDGYDSTLALAEIDDADWPEMIKKGHRKAILRRTTSVAKPVVEKEKKAIPPAAVAVEAPAAAASSAPSVEGSTSGADAWDEEAESPAEGAGSYDLSRWIGKTPKTMLLEWFQKMQAPRPKIELEPVGRRFRAHVIVMGDTKIELPEDELLDKREQAEQAAATAALFQLFGTGKNKQPLYRMLPLDYRALWLKWERNETMATAQLEADSAAAALLARERFVEALVNRPVEPWELSRSKRGKLREAAEAAQAAAAAEAAAAAAATAAEVVGDAIAHGDGRLADEQSAQAARMRQRAREEEEEAMLAAQADEEEAQRELADRRAAEAAADGARLQIGHERWAASEVGLTSSELRASLPISKLAESLETAMADHQVAVLCGETGSGKSTQVPQLLLEASLAAGKGGNTFILCTQPRRIAATSLARRVATERGETPGGRGSLVGYQVRLEAKRTDATRLLYCTTGIALRMMLGDRPLEGVSHVVVDEVHERDTQTDLLLLLLREMLPSRPDLRVVCMSATVQAELFSRYFNGCPVLTCSGRSYPVTDTYLEDILATTAHVLAPDSPCRVSDYGQWNKATFALHRGGGASATQEWQDASTAANPDYDEVRYSNYPPCVHAALAQMNEAVINHDLIMELIDHIDQNLGEGAVLVFLPGFADISNLFNAMSASRRFGDRGAFRVLPLHSSLSPTEQSAVFDRMPHGVRKVVLATNIAETSITIDDAVFVIDSGRAKQSMFDERKQMRRLVDVWISQAEARQRAGRAGRVRAGYAFRLYTRDRFTSVMQPARLPEMLRGPLQELCLQLRLAPLLEQYDLRAAFARALEPPKETTVESAIVALQRSNALDASEALTPLGRHLAALPVEICIGRLMIYGALFKCVDPILLIAAALSDRSPFLQPLAKRDEARAAQICFNRDESDHLALVDAYNRWMHTRRTESASAAKRFCDRHFLSERSLQGMGEAAEQYWGNLAELGLLPDLRRIQGEEDKFAARCSANVHADSPRLLKAVLAAGLFPNVLLASPGRARPTLTQQKQSVSIHPSSFNHMATKFETSFLVFHEKVKTNKIVVHDVTAVTALDLLLLTGEPQVLHAQHRVLIDQWIDLKISPRIAVLFKGLRNEIFELMRRRIDRSASTGPHAGADESPSSGDGPLCSYSAQSTVLDAVVEMIKQGTAAAELNPDANKEKALATASGAKSAAGSKSGRGSGSKGNGRGGGRR